MLPGLYLAEKVLRPKIHLAAAKHIVYCQGISKIGSFSLLAKQSAFSRAAYKLLHATCSVAQ